VVGTLNELIGERSFISGIHLAIDHGRAAEFRRSLRTMPAVAGVIERTVVVAAFRRTMARTLTIIVSFFVLFAGLTTLGVVYSSARIKPSEHERLRARLTGQAAGFLTRSRVGAPGTRAQ
jgi:putative ABC transport system permease protein